MRPSLTCWSDREREREEQRWPNRDIWRMKKPRMYVGRARKREKEIKPTQGRTREYWSMPIGNRVVHYHTLSSIWSITSIPLIMVGKSESDRTQHCSSLIPSANVSVFTSVKLVRRDSRVFQSEIHLLGVQIGNACWELYCLEHGIEPDGTFSKERDGSHIISKRSKVFESNKKSAMLCFL